MISRMLLALLLLCTPAYAGMGMGPGPGLTVGLPTATGSTDYDFEDTTLQGWSAGSFATSTTNPHAGSRCISGVSGYTEKSITPVSGNLNFWYRSTASGEVKVNGVTVLSLPSTSDVWTEQTVAISGTVIRFYVPAGNMSLDDISVPTP